jgi:hypothetical protein
MKWKFFTRIRATLPLGPLSGEGATLRNERWLDTKTTYRKGLKHMRCFPAAVLALLSFCVAGRVLGQESTRAAISPTFENVKYGPHERNVLDFWQAKSEQPTPLLVSIHGADSWEEIRACSRNF